MLNKIIGDISKMANTNNVETIMRNAIESATSHEHEYVTLEHIVLNVLNDPEILMICEQLEVDVDIIRPRYRKLFR